MLGTVARLLFTRILPRRLLPLIALWEVWRLVRGREKGPGDRSGDASKDAGRTTGRGRGRA